MVSHPYISGPGNITQMIGFLRKNFPATVTAETVKKFALAPKNESYVINALQFIGIIDDEGKRTEAGHKIFVLNDKEFPEAFEDLIKGAYLDLFDLRGDEAWSMAKSELTSYFRTTDKTSEVIGSRQASVFQTFRSLAGHEHPTEKVNTRSPPKSKQAKANHASTATPKASASRAQKTKVDLGGTAGRKDMALTVRIEINLPANGSKETYDNIFKSIRSNLING